MKTYIIFLFALLTLTASAMAQSLSRSVLGATGSTNEQLSYTVGETVIHTGEATNAFLTQGFQQPDVLSGTFVDPLLGSADYKLYPNPTQGILTLEVVTDRRRKVTVEIVDVHGRSVVPGQGLEIDKKAETTFDVSTLATAGYVLVLRNEAGNVVKGIRFQKVESY